MDLADELEIADAPTRRGLVRAVPGFMDYGHRLAAWKRDLAARGFGAGFLLVQLVSYLESRIYDIPELDMLVTGFGNVEPQSCITFTAPVDAKESWTALVGFAGQSGEG